MPDTVLNALLSVIVLLLQLPYETGYYYYPILQMGKQGRKMAEIGYKPTQSGSKSPRSSDLKALWPL